MRDSTLIRRAEPFFMAGLAIIYVIRRLLEEVSHIDYMTMTAQRQMAAAITWSDLGGYNYILNNNVPLIASMVLFLGAWYVVHYLAWPQLNQDVENRRAWLYGGLALGLLLISVFIYHYLKLYIRYRYDSVDHIIGLKVYSLYRKRTVLADTFGLAILLVAYELVTQFYVYLTQKIAQESQQQFRLVSYLLLGGVFLLALTFALTGYVPRTLWSYPFRDKLLTLGIIIQVYFLQNYYFTYILPSLRQPRTSESLLISGLIVYLLAGFIGTFLLWGAADAFYFRPPARFMPLLLITYIASISIAYLRQVLTREKTGLQTQVSTKAAELASLRAQINPHFLFNALNSLYATALKENSEKTADGIQKLGDMMRFMLQENNRDRIPLSKEVEYLHNYIQLQRMRLDESHGIELRVNIQEPDRDIYLAPMLLIPFVENAFKHGISLRNPSWIYITLTLDATKLYFKVHNSLYAKHAHDTEAEQSGVGLDNVRKRLNLIYPNRHQLDIQQSEQDYFVALTLVYW